jgi:hypothetical protein
MLAEAMSNLGFASAAPNGLGCSVASQSASVGGRQVARAA